MHIDPIEPDAAGRSAAAAQRHAPPPTSGRDPLTALREVQPLRDLQRINAAFSTATGLTMAAAGGWLSRHLDLPQPIVALLGVGLVGWSALLVVLAVQPVRRLLPASRLVAAGDAVWVIGSAVVIATAGPTTTGTVVITVAGSLVATFAVAGLLLGRRARRHARDGRTEILFGSVTVEASPIDTWEMVLDADLYARLAPNLSEIIVASDECGRTCTDRRGQSWTEAMQVDHERHVQRIEVDITEHPMPLDQLAARISVDDDANGSRIDIAFTYVTQATTRGLLISLVLPVLGRRLLRPITSGWAHHAATETRLPTRS